MALKVWTAEGVKEDQHWIVEDYNPSKREGEHEADFYVTRKIVGENKMLMSVTFNDSTEPFTVIMAETDEDGETTFIDRDRLSANRGPKFEKVVLSAYRRYRRECQAKIDQFIKGEIELEETKV